jgi:putative PIN family toxin of toxin-antitoxin system
LVLDTNVIVSGLLNPQGAPGRILDLVVAGEIQVLYDDRILAEYREVLARKELALQAEPVARILELIEYLGETIAAGAILSKALPDPDDCPFLEVALTGQADALVTGNARHFPLRARAGMTVLGPAELLARLTRR